MSNEPNRILDELARLITNAACAAKGASQEAEGVLRSWTEKTLNRLDVVRREEFEVLKEVTLKAVAENEALTRRIEALEIRLNIVSEVSLNQPETK